MHRKSITALLALVLSVSSARTAAADAVSIDALRTSGLTFEPIKGAKNVAVKTKGQRMAAFGIGMLVGSAMGSGAANPQEGMEIAQQAGNLTQQAIHDYGHERVGLLGPAPVMQKALQKRLGEMGVPLHAADAANGYRLLVQQKLWSLEYEGMFKDDYHLAYATEVSMKSPDGKKAGKASCAGQFPDLHPLPEWQADEHAKVVDAATAIGAECAELVAQALNLSSEA
ncbi:hypothetical protein [Lysobacter sp. FW306-1B-D06B]|uniref:hypothetical protein n=1 Tax=Lysobacter sp. FW306-1B-D06B TaxID=3140250 RepID=UPI0031402BDE